MATRQEREAADWLRRLEAETDPWWAKQACERFGIEPTDANVGNIQMLATKLR
jgi:hypothetical protein